MHTEHNPLYPSRSWAMSNPVITLFYSHRQTAEWSTAPSCIIEHGIRPQLSPLLSYRERSVSSLLYYCSLEAMITFPEINGAQVSWVSSAFYQYSHDSVGSVHQLLLAAVSPVQPEWRIHTNTAAGSEQGEHSHTGTYRIETAGTAKHWRTISMETGELLHRIICMSLGDSWSFMLTLTGDTSCQLHYHYFHCQINCWLFIGFKGACQWYYTRRRTYLSCGVFYHSACEDS